MQAFVIYLDQSRLEWSLDRETRQAVGHDCVVFHCFVDRSDAESVMREVPELFDLDAEDAEDLRIVTIEIPI